VKTLALSMFLLVGAAAISAPPAVAEPPARIGVVVSVGFAPPALPVYVQPICPGEGYIWTPGYWAYSEDGGYYWVPGTWVLAPEVGFLWTPPYWGFFNGAYVFHEGYWGPHVGFYGGVVYGFGYFGRGFEGGRWEGGHFFYNRTVTNVNVTVIHNTYNTRVHETVNRVSYNGGNGGINARATAEEERAASERHVGAVGMQNRHVEEARANREFRASENHGKPPIAATARPAEFKGNGAVGARAAGGEYHAPPANRAAENRAAEERRQPENRAVEEKRTAENRAAGDRAASAARPAVHPRDLPTPERHTVSGTGDAKLDNKHQQQQDELMAKQNQQRQKLQQQQEKDHQQLAKQHADEARQQQVEQKHAQQTQHMAQQHAAQQQKMQQNQQPPQQQHAASKPSGGKPERP
jgi:hypothetical protein